MQLNVDSLLLLVAVLLRVYQSRGRDVESSRGNGRLAGNAGRGNRSKPRASSSRSDLASFTTTCCAAVEIVEWLYEGSAPLEAPQIAIALLAIVARIASRLP